MERAAKACMGLLFATLLAVAPAAVARAEAGPGVDTRLELSVKSSTVTGRPLKIGAVVLDARGEPVPGALIRLEAPADFMGSQADEILDEATTDASGAATLTFAPREAGQVDVTARVAETPQYAPAEASLTFRVREPVPGYRKAPVGVGGRWARSYLVLVPLAGVWLTYLVVLGKARKIRRLGRPVRSSGVTSSRMPVVT